MPISRQGWAFEIVKGGERDALGFVLYEVRFWTSAARQRDGLGSHVIDGQPCDLMNNFKMQIRTNHQRIVTKAGDLQEPEGYLLHSDGLLWVPRRVTIEGKLLADFLTLNSKPTSGYTPWMFENYAGVDEPLSGMWQHERHTLDLLAQAEANIERYIDVARRERWEGDRRGTTLNFQVGASTDDGYVRVTIGFGNVRTDADFFNNGGTFISAGTISTGFGQSRGWFQRHPSVAIPAAATIDAADITLTGQFGESSSAELVIEAIDADDAPAPTGIGEWNAQAFTTASVTWDFSDTWTDGLEFTSVDFKAVIQEVLDRGGWATGQALIVCPLDDLETDTDRRRSPHSYDSATAKAPKLDITFTAGGAPGPSVPPGSGIGTTTAATLKAQGAHTGRGEPHYVAQIILDLVTGGIDNEPPPQSFELTLARILAQVNGQTVPQIGYSSEQLINELHDFMMITRERRKPITGQLIDIMEAL